MVICSDREIELNGRCVRVSGYVRSAEVRIVFPEQLVDEIQVQIPPSRDTQQKFDFWCDSSTKDAWSKISTGALVEVETLLRKPLFGNYQEKTPNL